MVHNIDDIGSHVIDIDSPEVEELPSGNLADTLDAVSKKVGNGRRLPMPKSHIHSFRIATDAPSKVPSSAREYKVTKRPNARYSPSEKVYIWKQKFKRLQFQISNLEMPDSTDPDALERMYHEALRTHHHSSSTGTWMIYMGLGYAGAQYIMGKLGISGIDNYAIHQMEVMKHYPELIKQLGEPGGPSIGSSWPPWLKLASIMVIHSIVYLVITGITRDETRAHNMQKVICSTGIMKGTSEPTSETDIAGDSAMSNIGQVFSGLLNGGGGGMIGNIMNMMSGDNPMDDIDLENPPQPDSSIPSNRPNMFS